ncbi:GPW/gp25 family protein (plasmid) [Burkholderia sp. MS455]|uniref:GPW/gp25 family protein n=1 Tax=Burkholderia sp. MS455 TaxID=2811788 RepID=UPI001959108E|nr:GPW/gp25 family protein [Burkholderia sp. MS455]QRR07653.1 GPW/gp25 family protein [Burkholderia sp. MS455]QRR11841.1 GPW/gp25 family protein [Burkholderia sp. MS455]
MDNQDNELVRLYGTGWKFPLTFDLPAPVVGQDIETRSAVVMSAGTDNVAQSLAMLFQTQPGERIMRAAYGCDMQSMVFENVSEATLASLHSRISESVARYEPRAEGVTIAMQEDARQAGTLRIELTYRLAGQTRQVSGSLNLSDGVDGGWNSWATS